MANLITNVSKYLMILLIAIYTYYNFRFFGIRDEWGKRRLCRLQNVVMVLIHTLAYIIIYLRTEDERTLMFFGAQLLFFFLYMGLYRLFYRNLSRLLLNNACMLLSTSFIILTRISMDRAVRQLSLIHISGINEYNLSLFIQEEEDLYRKYQETHYQKAYSLDEVKAAVKEAGMELAAIYDAFTRNAPSENSERIYVIARERGKNIKNDSRKEQ